ncbi:MAG TPA: hypothetical protein VJ183_07630 [Chloroflexia bacterium]|nr:hypothetical protein [Chloroflexia bacterium]
MSLSTNSVSAEQLKANFRNEVEWIVEYVKLVSRQARVSGAELLSLIEILRQHGLISDGNISNSQWQNLMLPSTVHTQEHLGPLAELISAVIPRLEMAKAAIAPKLDALARETLSKGSRLIVETANYLFMLNPDEDNPDFQELWATLVDNLGKQDDGSVLESDEESGLTIDQVVDQAIKLAQFYRVEHKFQKLLGVEDQISNLRLSMRLSQPDAEINIWRQGFISLMTVFEATVFDLVRAAFRTDFFSVLALFTGHPGVKNDRMSKLSLEYLAHRGSFDRLQDSVIEELLASKYLKELLFNLRKLDVLPEKLPLAGSSTTANSAEVPFIELIELVLRRNVHLHNRGIVDDDYLQYNVGKLALGDLATISDSYFSYAYLLCIICVDILAAWATTLATVPTTN